MAFLGRHRWYDSTSSWQSVPCIRRKGGAGPARCCTPKLSFSRECHWWPFAIKTILFIGLRVNFYNKSHLSAAKMRRHAGTVASSPCTWINTNKTRCERRAVDVLWTDAERPHNHGNVRNEDVDQAQFSSSRSTPDARRQKDSFDSCAARSGSAAGKTGVW